MTTIDALLRESLRGYPLKTALRHKEGATWRDLSYRALSLLVDQVSSGLHASGFVPGERAAIIAPSSSRWVASYFGILRAGGIVVPIDKELKNAELSHILADSEARVVFVDSIRLDMVLDMPENLTKIQRLVLLDDLPGSEMADTSEKGILREIRNELRGLLDSLPLSSEQTNRLRAVVEKVSSLPGLNDGSDSGAGAVEDPLCPNKGIKGELIHSGGLVSFKEFRGDVDVPEPSHTAEDPALILYTSGTTGRSKGAILSHGNIISNIRGAASRFSVNNSTHTLSFLPINHVFEQVCGLLLPLSMGGTVSFAESLKKLGENLVEVRPTLFTGVPAVYRLFHDRIMKNIRAKKISNLLFSVSLTRGLIVSRIKRDFTGGTMFISGGAALDPEIAQGLRLLGFSVFQGYGVTETSPVISAECPGQTRTGSVGPLLDGVEVMIDGANEEGVGEILVRGPNVMQGYFKNPVATAEALAGGWYHTGDLGRLDEEGFLFICGRVKNVIVTPNGKNVYPEEVEIELLKSPYIAEVMVYGHKVDAVSEEVHALIFPAQEALDEYEKSRDAGPMSEADVETLIRKEVLTACRSLADYKRVKRFTLREDEFPKTTTRKIKRFAMEADVPIC